MDGRLASDGSAPSRILETADFLWRWNLRQLYWSGYYCEHAFVLALEFFRRSIRRLDPRLYFESLRLKKIHEGNSCKTTGKFVVLVIYANSSLPSFTTSLIEALRDSPFNLVVVSNGHLSASASKQLLQDCHLLIERVNVGQDFGGYKDAISVIRRRVSRIERLVIANDSVVYLREGLDTLIAGIDGTDEFIGVSEVFDHHYHVASFLVSFGESVVSSEVFVRFWNRFLPIGTRRWNIFRGEGALTARLLRAGFRPRILYRAEHLRRHLETAEKDDLATAVALLPKRTREKVTKKLATASLEPKQSRRESESGGLVNAIVGAVIERNQMHTGGFLFRRYLGSPVIKRDLYYRQEYAMEDITRILSDLSPSIRDAVIADFGRRGTTADAGWFHRLLCRHSAA